MPGVSQPAPHLCWSMGGNKFRADAPCGSYLRWDLSPFLSVSWLKRNLSCWFIPLCLSWRAVSKRSIYTRTLPATCLWLHLWTFKCLWTWPTWAGWSWVLVSCQEVPDRPTYAAFLGKLMIELQVFSFHSGTVRAPAFLPEEENMKQTQLGHGLLVVETNILMCFYLFVAELLFPSLASKLRRLKGRYLSFFFFFFCFKELHANNTGTWVCLIYKLYQTFS